MLGPRRFSDLRRGLPGISANVLSQRLSQLEDFGVVTRGSLPMLPGIVVYRLTDWGREIEPVFQALGRWGVRSPFRQGGSFSAASFLLSLRTMFDPAKAAGLRLRIGLVADGVALDARVADGGLSIAPGDIAGADAALAGTAPALAGAIYGAEPVLQLAAAGAIRLTGAAAYAQAFCDLYALPPPAPLPDG